MSSRNSTQNTPLVLRSAPKVQNTTAISIAKRRRFRRRIDRFLTLFLLVFIASASIIGGGNLLGGSTGGSQPAHAANVDCVMFADTADGYDRDDILGPRGAALGAWPGTLPFQESMTEVVPSEIDYGFANATGGSPGEPLPYENTKKVTPQEWWGTAGMTWSAYPNTMMGVGCGADPLIARVMNPVAAFAFELTKRLAVIGLNVFSWAFSFDAFTPLIDAIADFLEQMQQKLYLVYLPPILIFSGVWILWQGMVKKRSSEGFQGAIWVFAAAAFGYAFLAAPAALMAIPNDIVNTVNTSLLNTTSTLAVDSIDESKSASLNLCSVKFGGGGGGENAVAIKAERTANCVMWDTFIFRPWAEGQFGPAAMRKLNTEEVELPEPTFRPEYEEYQTIALTYLDAVARNHDMVVKGEQLSADDSAVRLEAINRTLACNADNDDVADADWSCENSDAWSYYTGVGFADRITTAITGFIAVIAGMGPLIFLAFTLILFQITAIFLYLAAPIFLTVGIHPGFGRRATMGWFEMIASNALKRIGTAGLISLGIMMLQLVTSAGLNGALEMIMIIGTGMSLIFFRGRILDRISKVSFGGDPNIANTAGYISGKPKSVAKGAAKRAGKGVVAGGGTYLAGGNDVTAGEAAATGAAAALTPTLAAPFATWAATNKDKRNKEKQKKTQELREQVQGNTPAEEKENGDRVGPTADKSTTVMEQQVARTNELLAGILAAMALQKASERRKQGSPVDSYMDDKRARMDEDEAVNGLGAGGVESGEWGEFDNTVKHILSVNGFVPRAKTGDRLVDEQIDRRAALTMLSEGVDPNSAFRNQVGVPTRPGGATGPIVPDSYYDSLPPVMKTDEGLKVIKDDWVGQLQTGSDRSVAMSEAVITSYTDPASGQSQPLSKPIQPWAPETLDRMKEQGVSSVQMSTGETIAIPALEQYQAAVTELQDRAGTPQWQYQLFEDDEVRP